MNHLPIPRAVVAPGLAVGSVRKVLRSRPPDQVDFVRDILRRYPHTGDTCARPRYIHSNLVDELEEAAKKVQSPLRAIRRMDGPHLVPWEDET